MTISFKYFFMGISWVAVSIFDFNGVNVAKHWHGGGARYLPSLIALLFMRSEIAANLNVLEFVKRWACAGLIASMVWRHHQVAVGAIYTRCANAVNEFFFTTHWNIWNNINHHHTHRYGTLPLMSLVLINWIISQHVMQHLICLINFGN